MRRQHNCCSKKIRKIKEAELNYATLGPKNEDAHIKITIF